MPINLDAFDSVRGRKPTPSVVLNSDKPRRWRTLDTVACELIARRRAQRLLDAGEIIAAVPWLRYANAMMVRNNVARLVRGHKAAA